LPTREQFRRDSSWDSAEYHAIRKRGIGWATRVNDPSPLFMAIIGRDTVFDEGHSVVTREVPPDCLLMVEVLRDDLFWADPVDIDVTELANANDDRIPKWIGSELGSGFHAAFADCEVWFLSRQTPASLLVKYAEVSDEGHRERSKDFAPYRIR
jgi:hypothetical protein